MVKPRSERPVLLPRGRAVPATADERKASWLIKVEHELVEVAVEMAGPGGRRIINAPPTIIASENRGNRRWVEPN